MNEQPVNGSTINPGRPRCFIVTVGTSLLSQYLNPPGNGRPLRANWTIEAIENENGATPAVFPVYHSQKSGCSTSSYAQAFTNLNKTRSSWTTVGDLHKASAELNSLYHMTPLPGSHADDVVILIATQTPTGCLCATLLKQVLCSHPNELPKVGTVCIKQPEGLGLANNDKKFAEQGLPNFLACLSELVQEMQPTHDVALIPTGGYKSLIPYTTLAGMFHEVPVKYIYEESDVLLDLPSVPVGLDMEQWQTGALFLEQMRDRPWGETEAWRESLGRGFRSLVVKDQRSKAQITALGEWLIKRFQESRHGTLLQAQTGHQALLRFLKPTKLDLEVMFQQLVAIGPYLWLGDKVPEMVDHGPYHHRHLFEMADLMLVPLQHAAAPLLTTEELFIFLCVIYLHDCGHVYASFPDMPPLLPTQIREYHHILGYERLKSEDWRQTMRDRGLTWGSTCNEMWDKYLNVIAAVAMFHRRKMPLRETESPYRCLANGRLYGPLEKAGCWPLKFEDQPFCNDRALFLAALFRVLDGLDNQLGRAGGTGEMQIKAAVLRDDAKAQELQAAEVEKTVQAYCNGKNKLIEQVKALIDRITGAYEGAGHRLEATSGTNEVDIEAEIKTIATSAADAGLNLQVAAGLIRLYVEAETKAFFKKTQMHHYFDHLIFDAPDIKAIPSHNGEPCRIEITLKPVSQERYDGYAETFAKLSEGFTKPNYTAKVEEIKGKITSEYSAQVEEILGKRNLVVTYNCPGKGNRGLGCPRSMTKS